MDLLFGQVIERLSPVARKKYENNTQDTIDRLSIYPSGDLSPEISAKILDTAIQYISEFMAVRYHQSIDVAKVESLDATLRGYEDSVATRGYVLGLRGVMHVARREQPDSPYRWPTHYLDVYPALQDDWRVFIAHVRERDLTVAANGVPNELIQPPSIRMPNINMSDFHTDFADLCGPDTNEGYAAAKACQCAATAFVKNAAAQLLSELPPSDTAPKLVWIFDPYREIKPIRQGLPRHIYVFDILYRFCGWGITEKYVKTYPRVVSNNLKIAMRLVYDILIELVPQVRGANRLMRFYLIYNYNIGIWKEIDPKWHPHVKVAAQGDGYNELYILYDRGKPNMEAVHEYGKKYHIDNLFGNFLANLFKMDISLFPVNKQPMNLRW